jgi:hypothetical protein
MGGLLGGVSTYDERAGTESTREAPDFGGDLAMQPQLQARVNRTSSPPGFRHELSCMLGLHRRAFRGNRLYDDRVACFRAGHGRGGASGAGNIAATCRSRGAREKQWWHATSINPYGRLAGSP